MENSLEKIPRLREAIEAEQHIRDTAFLSLPESVCGFDVRPLTLRHVLTLGVIRSPFLLGGHPTPSDVGAFFIVVGEWSGFRRWRNLRKLARVGFIEAAGLIDGFVKEAFQDSPQGNGESGVSYYSVAASIVDVFGKEYGWNETEILDAPLKRLFQYLNAIAWRRGETILFNPSDRIRGQWLADVNRN